ncbi:hypothetical protein MMC12_001768 [Toensbergia leucococca]|nr:hypothetical protein [Toensbergia leucococca]
MATDATSNCPISSSRLNLIAKDACESTFQSVKSYEHSQTSSWNSNIINTILQSLIKDSSSDDRPPLYKYAVTSTIIQHTTSPRPHQPEPEIQNRADAADEAPRSTNLGGRDNVVGRRGMHSATGAYWNNEKDGMWSFKYDGGEGKGFDVVISVVWISIS